MLIYLYIITLTRKRHKHLLFSTMISTIFLTIQALLLFFFLETCYGYNDASFDLMKTSMKNGSPCTNRCVPVWHAIYDCHNKLNNCVLKGCKRPHGGNPHYPYLICTERGPMVTPTPSPSPASTGCKTSTKDHPFEGEFGAVCTCPNLGVTFIHKTGPTNEVLQCMRRCYERSNEFLEACHEYKRKNVNGDLSEIRPVYLKVGRGCCENECHGTYVGGLGKPICTGKSD